jgi:hypothetical protein
VTTLATLVVNDFALGGLFRRVTQALILTIDGGRFNDEDQQNDAKDRGSRKSFHCLPYPQVFVKGANRTLHREAIPGYPIRVFQVANSLSNGASGVFPRIFRPRRALFGTAFESLSGAGSPSTVLIRFRIVDRETIIDAVRIDPCKAFAG